MIYSDDKQLAQQGAEWMSDRLDGAQTLDFIVTEDCNLRCKYCYICHKKSNHVMTLETAKKFINYLFSGELEFPPAVILGFIGGEPLIEVELIDQIVDYFKIQAYEKNSPWYWNYRISITTNGVNYSSPQVQYFIAKNRDKLSLSITIDGTKEKHDMQRVFPDGRGSYDTVVKNIPQYVKAFYPTTKVTFSHKDLPLLKESIIHLWNLGIIDISANCVFEDVWKDGDDKILEEQLKSLADYMIESGCYKDYSVSFFDPHIGKPMSEERKNQNVCGAGLMLGIGPTGKIYPCMRYKDYSLENKEEIVIGHVDTGIDFDKVIRFRVSNHFMQCDEECLNCPIADGCMYCQAQSYDSADTPTNFQRSKYICRMHKARVRANNYFYNRLYNEKGIEEKLGTSGQSMYAVLSDDFETFCECSYATHGSKRMGVDMVKQLLEYSAYYFFSPVFVHSKGNPDFSLFEGNQEYRIQHILSARFYKEVEKYRNYILVFDKSLLDIPCEHQESCILNINWKDAGNLYEYAVRLFEKADRINLNMLNDFDTECFEVYKEELYKISEYLFVCWTKSGSMKEFNKITDVMFGEKPEFCAAGKNLFAVSPDGSIYTCPIAYVRGGKPVGNIYNMEMPVVKNQRLYSLEYAAVCKICPASHCVRCAETNFQKTGEVNIPPYYKCLISMAEYEVSQMFLKSLKKYAGEDKLSYRELPDFFYNTPYEYVFRNEKLGYKMKRRKNDTNKS